MLVFIFHNVGNIVKIPYWVDWQTFPFEKNFIVRNVHIQLDFNNFFAKYNAKVLKII